MTAQESESKSPGMRESFPSQPCFRIRLLGAGMGNTAMNHNSDSKLRGRACHVSSCHCLHRIGRVLRSRVARANLITKKPKEASCNGHDCHDTACMFPHLLEASLRESPGHCFASSRETGRAKTRNISTIYDSGLRRSAMPRPRIQACPGMFCSSLRALPH